MENVFSQRGGARIGSFNAAWPFARYRIDSNKIELKVFSKGYLFLRNEIVALRKYEGIISLGILIEHQKSEYPHHIVFWTFNYENLKKSTEILGYKVGEPKRTDAWWRGGP